MRRLRFRSLFQFPARPPPRLRQGFGGQAFLPGYTFAAATA
jgi:hypothetical protein